MNKTEVCSYISEYVLTKNGQLPAKEGLRKFDRPKLESSVQSVYSIIIKMAQAMERDFDYLIGKNRN